MIPLALLAIAASAPASGCPAPAVHTERNALLPAEFRDASRWFTARPRRLYGIMWSGRAVDGRLSVYAHGSNPITGISEKIMWIVPQAVKRQAGTRLRMQWIRAGRVRKVQRVGDPPRHASSRHYTMYPSILRAPSPGCWTLKLRTGRVRATIRVLVQPQPRA